MKPTWVLAGLLLGALPSLLVNLPAAWLAASVQQASAGRVLLADATGTLWAGSALLALTGGASQATAAVLPGRLSWRLGWHAGRPAAWLRQSCCTETPLVLSWQPGWSRQRLTLQPETPASGSVQAWGQWPLGLLGGLGTPWNTLRLTGQLQLMAPEPLKLTLEQGRVGLEGQLELGLHQVASRLSPLPALGSYRLQLSAQPSAGPAQVLLQTLKGPLQLQGTGQWSQQGLQLRGQASAEPGSEASLNNLLNIIGVRDGAVSNILIQ
jgi:general secretion pathway protein N